MGSRLASRGNLPASFAVFFILYLIPLFSNDLRADERGRISGTIQDASGAVVPNARVTVTNVATGTMRTGRADERGNYVFADLAVCQDDVAV